MRTALVATVLLLCLGLVPAAEATTADEICSGNPCVVQKNTTRIVTPGSILDFGARDLQLMGGAKLVVGAGSMVIKVRNLTLEPASGLLGAGGMIEVDATGTITVRRDGNSISRIDTAGDAAGSITLNAMGNVVVEGILDASSTAVDQFAGDITVTGASIVIPGEIDIHGGRDGSPGTLEIDAAANLGLSGTIDSSGGDSDVEGILLTAGGAVTTTGKIDLSAITGGGFGGALEIDADGSVILGGNINVRGDSSGEDVGDAGDITVNSGDSIQIGAFLQMTGVPSDGAGGSATFTAEHDITQSVAIDASGNGLQSQGGSLEFEAHRNLTLGSIDVHGGSDGFGGSVDATAWCALTLPAGITLDARGLGGTNSLESGGALTVAGTMLADTANFIEYRSASDPISITGVINPNSGAQINPNLTPCGGFPPPPPPADCGDGKVDQGELCDGAPVLRAVPAPRTVSRAIGAATGTSTPAKPATTATPSAATAARLIARGSTTCAATAWSSAASRTTRATPTRATASPRPVRSSSAATASRTATRTATTATKTECRGIPAPPSAPSWLRGPACAGTAPPSRTAASSATT